MRQTIGKIVNRLLRPTGYRFARIPPPPAPPAPPPAPDPTKGLTLEAALARVSGRGVAVNTIIDVGASNGSWTRTARRFFPDAAALLIEANPVHAADLERFRQEFGHVDFVLAAAGDTIGEIFFDANDPWGGLASHTPLEAPTIRVPVTTIDAQVAERGLKPPFLIKLDTHGFEVPILDGARQALRQANLLVIEAYNFQLNPSSIKFHELCQLLAGWGFATIDFSDPLFRARDNAFWQFDLYFVRADREEFKVNSYR